MDLHERLLRQGGLQLGRALEQAALVHEQRVAEQHELAVAHRHRPGVGHRGGRAGLVRRQQAAQLGLELFEGLPAEFAAHHQGEAGEDLPVGLGDARRAPDGSEPLTAALPGGDVPPLLQIGRGGQEHVRVRLQLGELEALHHDVGHVLQRATGQRGVRGVAQRIHADAEQDVDLAGRAGLEDRHGPASLGRGHDRTPDRLDLRALLVHGEPPPAGQQPRVHPRLQRATVVRAARDVGEPRPGAAGERPRLVNRSRPVGEARPRDDHGGVARLRQRVGDAGAVAQRGGLAAREDEHVLRDVVQARRPRVQHDDAGSPRRGLAQAKVQDRHLLLGVEARHQDHLRALDVAIRDGAGRGCDERLCVAAAGVAPVIEVVGAEHGARELRQRVVVLVHQPAAREERDARPLRPAGDPGERLAERGGLQAVVAHEGRGQSPRIVGEPQRVPALVAQPRVVDLELVPREVADDLPATDVDAEVAAAAAVWADAVGGGEVERPRGEAVRRGRERADGADLDGVAAERRREVLAGRDRDLLGGAPRIQLDEPVAADLVAEAGTARAQHAALAVEAHQRRQRHGLGVGALGLDVTALARTERHGLILQRALPAAVADRTVQRVVQQQELEVRHLRLVHRLGGVLRSHRHVRSDRGRAGGEQLALALDLHVALPARPDRLQQRMVAEARDLHPHLLGGADDQRALRHGHLRAVDRERDEIRH